MGDFVRRLIEDWGALGVLLVVFIESGILPAPLPGDSLLFLAGFYATAEGAAELGLSKPLSLPLVVIGAFVCAVAGAQIGYAIGARFGTRLFTPTARIFKTKYLHKSHDFFERRGPAAVVLARFVPFVRTIIPMLAGASTMRARSFLIANIIGAALWAVGISLLGYFLGSHLPESLIEPVLVLIIALSLIPPLLEWRKHRREQRTAAAPEA